MWFSPTDKIAECSVRAFRWSTPNHKFRLSAFQRSTLQPTLLPHSGPMSRKVTVRSPDQQQATKAWQLLQSAGEFSQSVPAETGSLLIADVATNVAGATYHYFSDDRTCWLWGPVIQQPYSISPDDIGAAMIAHITTEADREGAWLTQCLLNERESLTTRLLLANGFTHIADVDILRRTVDDLDLVPPPAADVTFRSWQKSSHREFASLLERTWIDSFDCKPLLNKRNGNDALFSHATQTEGSQSELWNLMYVNNQPAGVLLLSHSADDCTAAMDVVYMGIVPEFRGKSLGLTLLRHALQTAINRSAQSIQLAVDTANIPARRVYDSFHFQAVQRIYCLGRFPQATQIAG